MFPAFNLDSFTEARSQLEKLSLTMSVLYLRVSKEVEAHPRVNTVGETNPELAALLDKQRDVSLATRFSARVDDQFNSFGDVIRFHNEGQWDGFRDAYVPFLKAHYKRCIEILEANGINDFIWWNDDDVEEQEEAEALVKKHFGS